jgi:hypothetical protein
MRQSGRTLLLLLCLAAAPAAAGVRDLALRPVAWDGDTLRVAVEIPGLLSPRLWDRLEKGLPFTMELEADLWRERRGWLDARVARIRRVWKVLFDPWSRTFTLRQDADTLVTADALEARRLLERPLLSLPLPRGAAAATYHVTARCAVKLMTAEDIREVEEWVGGHLRDRPLLRLPGALLGLLKDAAGLGDVVREGNSPSFNPAELPVRSGEEAIRR